MRERFQFLNLAGAGGSPQKPEAKEIGEIQKCVAFTFLQDPDDANSGVESQDRDLKICQRLADALRAEGFEVGTAARFKPWGAGATIQFTNFRLRLWLVSKWRSDGVECYLSTSTQPRDESRYLGEDWVRVRVAIEKALLRVFRSNSPRWLTVDQCEDLQFEERS